MSPPRVTTPVRLREGWPATLVLLLAALILLGISRTAVVTFSDHLPAFRLTVALIALALPGPVLRLWDLPGQLLLWNATGWCLALVVLGMTSIGATPILPLVLLLLGLSLWPRETGTPPFWLPGAIALAGGFIACAIVWNDLVLPLPVGSFAVPPWPRSGRQA